MKWVILYVKYLVSLVWEESGGGVGDFSVSSADWAEEKILYGGDGGAVLRGPDAGLAAGIVAYGYCDVAHGCPPGLGGILASFLHCAPGEANCMQSFLQKNLVPDAKIEPTTERLESR